MSARVSVLVAKAIHQSCAFYMLSRIRTNCIFAEFMKNDVEKYYTPTAKMLSKI
jgi:hypothetical protein